MKKYMIPMLAFLLIAGVTSAQSTDKKPAKATTTKSVSAAKKTAATAKSASTASVSPQKATTAHNTVIKRKHHKKSKPAKKTESK